jgi:hypothetical protein
MKFSKWHFITRMVLFTVLGVVLGHGTDTRTGLTVIGIVCIIGLADWLHGECSAHRAFRAGQRDMADFVVRKGWRV